MDVETQIHAERVKAVFQQTPVAVLVTLANASLMVAVLAAVLRDHRAYAWLAAVLVVAVLRLVLWRAYGRAAPPPGRVQGWAAAATLGAGAAGLLWGVGAVLLSPDSQTYQLLWIFLIGGMCAGGSALHHAHLATALAFILPACLPVAVWFALDGAPHRLVAAAMIVVFVAALAVTNRRSSRFFGDVLRLQFGLAERTRELDAVNGRLKVEMAERRTAEATLHHAQKMEAVGRLTGGIAHDFNNLLTAVLGSLALLRKRLPPEDQHSTRLLDNARQGAERGVALTQRLLAFGRRQTLRPGAVDLSALVAGMSDLLQSSLGAGVQFEARFPAGLAPVHVDANQLELALLNLVVNARDAMPGGGTIFISAHEAEAGSAHEAEAGASGPAELPDGFYVVLGVADTGAGMDEATLAQAMEPFFTTKGVGKGTGLGLSMVHGLAVQSGGRLTLRSRKGEGTVAELWLPRADATALPAVPEPAPAPTRPSRRRTVLLVDDDPLVLPVAAAMLRDLGHVAVEANSARQALAILAAGEAVDLVLTDYTMPGMTGLQLADELRWRKPGLPVLLATGHAELQGEAAAGLPRLTKPFGQEELARATERCFGMPRPGQAHRDR